MRSGRDDHRGFETFTRYYYTNEFADEEVGGAMHDALAVEVDAFIESFMKSLNRV